MRYLKPVRIIWALLCSKDFNKSFILVPSNVAPIGSWEVTIKRSRVELCEHIDLWYVAVQTITDRNINKPVVGAQWHCRLRTLLRQGIQSSPCTTSKNDSENTLHKQKKLINCLLKSKSNKERRNKCSKWFVLSSTRLSPKEIMERIKHGAKSLSNNGALWSTNLL